MKRRLVFQHDDFKYNGLRRFRTCAKYSRLLRSKMAEKQYFAELRLKYPNQRWA